MEKCWALLHVLEHDNVLGVLQYEAHSRRAFVLDRIFRHAQATLDPELHKRALFNVSMLTEIKNDAIFWANNLRHDLTFTENLANRNTLGSGNPVVTKVLLPDFKRVNDVLEAADLEAHILAKFGRIFPRSTSGFNLTHLSMLSGNLTNATEQKLLNHLSAAIDGRYPEITAAIFGSLANFYSKRRKLLSTLELIDRARRYFGDQCILITDTLAEMYMDFALSILSANLSGDSTEALTELTDTLAEALRLFQRNQNSVRISDVNMISFIAQRHFRSA